VAPTVTTSSLRGRVDEHVREIITGSRSHMDAGAAPLLDEIARLVFLGGKRLRPVFCCWGHVAAGGRDDERILRVGAALEMLHTFAIIHDDVMDHSPIRRGGPSSHRALAAHAGASPWSEAFGVSAAILAGDLALVLADRALDECGFGDRELDGARRAFNLMRTEAIAGQYLDLWLAQSGDADEGRARRVAVLKSGSYTVVRPLEIGARLAGSGDVLLEALRRYGEPMGEAFQLRDDVLGTFGDERDTGKARDGDLREGKRTVLMAKACAMSSPDERHELQELLGSPALGPAGAERLREIIRSTGALRATVDLIDSLVASAIESVDPELMGAAAGPLVELARDVSVQSVS
jgi:geranylgeranyl diphosphate synthase type I